MHIRPFEIALIGIFAVAGLIGLFFLSNYTATDENAPVYGESVTIWGTLSREVMDNFILEMSRVDKALQVVHYTEIDPRDFESRLVNAIAEGKSPDLVILPHTLLVTYRSKLQAIPLETIPERTYRDTYIDGAEIFMRNDGIYGIPFAVDPLVMYWNRDLFSSSGLAQPPKTWESLSQTTKAITRLDDELTLTQSAIAFGEYANITHAKEILSMLFLQAGSTMVEEDGNRYRVTIDKGVDNTLPPGDAVLTFYTQFSSPSKELYSWNRSKGLDKSEFLGGNLGMYFGFGSERTQIERENSNLNFDVAVVPQGSETTISRTYGDFYAFAIPRGSKNIQGAYAVASLFASPANVKSLVESYELAPVHRTLYTGAVTDPFTSVVYGSALIARGWLDPSPMGSSEIFRKMIEEVTSGRTRLKGVMIDVINGLEALF